jgi:hypothetical protein
MKLISMHENMWQIPKCCFINGNKVMERCMCGGYNWDRHSITKVSVHQNRGTETARIVQLISRSTTLFNLGSHLVKLIGWEVVTAPPHTYTRPRNSLETKDGAVLIQGQALVFNQGPRGTNPKWLKIPDCHKENLKNIYQLYTLPPYYSKDPSNIVLKNSGFRHCTEESLKKLKNKITNKTLIPNN